MDSAGGRTTVQVKVDMGSFVVRDDDGADYQTGDVVVVMLPPKHLHVFDDRGSRLDIK